MEPWNESLNFIFPTTYVIPKSLKFSHWPSKKTPPWKLTGIPLDDWSRWKFPFSAPNPQRNYGSKLEGLENSWSWVVTYPNLRGIFQPTYIGCFFIVKLTNLELYLRSLPFLPPSMSAFKLPSFSTEKSCWKDQTGRRKRTHVAVSVETCLWLRAKRLILSHDIPSS